MQKQIPMLIGWLVFGGCGPRAPSSHLNATTVETYHDELGMRPGVGLDIIQHDVRGACVDFDGMATTGNGQEAIFDFRLIDGHSALFSSLGVSPSMQLRTLTNPSNTPTSHRAHFALTNGFSISKYSLYLMVSARIRNETSFIKNPRLSDRAANIFKNGQPNSSEAFRRQCGDSYLVGSTSGAEFYALIEIETSSDEEQQKLRSTYQGDMKSFGKSQTEAHLNSSISRLRRHQNLRVWTYQRGGSGEGEVGLVQSADQVIARLKTLADAARLGQNPRPLTATFSDYFTLGLEIPAEHLKKLIDSQAVIEELARKLGSLSDLKSDLNYILSHQSRFAGIDGARFAQINQILRLIDERIESISTAAKGCRDALDRCRVPSGIDTPAVELPKRRRNLSALTSERLVINTKLHYLDVYGISDSFSQPECYMKLNIGRHGDDHFITILRTPTYYGTDRCRNLETRLEFPVALVRDAFAQLGIAPEKGWVELQLFEDDAFYADFLGSTYISFRQLDSGAAMKGIHTPHINLQVDLLYAN